MLTSKLYALRENLAMEGVARAPGVLVFDLNDSKKNMTSLSTKVNRSITYEWIHNHFKYYSKCFCGATSSVQHYLWNRQYNYGFYNKTCGCSTWCQTFPFINLSHQIIHRIRSNKLATIEIFICANRKIVWFGTWFHRKHAFLLAIKWVEYLY